MKRDDKEPRPIPEHDPSKAMDSKREVEQSRDPKTDQDFPGYPHYPAREDIMDQRTDTHRADLEPENLASGPNAAGINQRFADASDRRKEDRTPPGEMEEGASNTKRDEDFLAKGTPNAERGTPQDVSNEDLDGELPGTDLNKAADES